MTNQIYPKPDINALLASGPLSGFEAGRLYLQESYARSKGRPVLNDQELNLIIEYVRSGEYDILKRLSDMGTVIEIILLKAHIYSLEAISSLQAGYFFTASYLIPFSTGKSPDREELLNLFKEFSQKSEQLAKIVSVCSQCLKIFKGFEVVIEDLARALKIGLYLVEMHNLSQRVEREVNTFNHYVGLFQKFARIAKVTDPMPDKFNFDRLKSDIRVVNAWRNKLAGQGKSGLGKRWWKLEASGND